MFLLYRENGQIFATVNDPAPPGYREMLESDGTLYLEMLEEDFDPSFYATSYVAGGAITQRPVFNVPDQISMTIGEAITLNLPTGTAIALDDGAAETLEGTTLEIEAEMPADYSIRLTNWPYIDKQIEVTINEA